jgi:hypothetical protein
LIDAGTNSGVLKQQLSVLKAADLPGSVMFLSRKGASRMIPEPLLSSF